MGRLSMLLTCVCLVLSSASSGAGSCDEVTSLVQLKSSLIQERSRSSVTRKEQDLEEESLQQVADGLNAHLEQKEPPQPPEQANGEHTEGGPGWWKWLGASAGPQNFDKGMIINGDDLPMSKLWKQWESVGADGGWQRFLPGASDDSGEEPDWAKWLPFGGGSNSQGHAQAKANGAQPSGGGPKLSAEDAAFLKEKAGEAGNAANSCECRGGRVSTHEYR